MIKEVTNIVKGHMNELLNVNKDISEVRLSICKECPLYLESNIGPMCNPNMYLDPNTGEYAFINKGKDFIKGCGCRLLAKTRLDDATCPAKRW